MKIAIIRARRSLKNEQLLFVDVEIDDWIVVKGIVYSIIKNVCYLPSLLTQRKIRYSPITFKGDKHEEFKTLFLDLIQDHPMPKSEEDNGKVQKNMDKRTESGSASNVPGRPSGQKKDPSASKFSHRKTLSTSKLG